MDRADIEKFRRHIRPGKTIKIGEDDFYFKPLPLKHLPDMMYLAGVMESQGEKALFTKENSKVMFDLLDDFVKNSYPDLDDETRQGFIIDNMIVLQDTLIETSMNSEDELTDSQKKKIAEMRKAQSEKKV